MGRDSADWKRLFTKAVELHAQGIEGDQDAVRRAYELLEKVRKLTGSNHLVDAYLGSTSALLARDIVDPLEKLKKATKGLNILDQAVTKDPKNTEIRILRAYVCSRIPEEFFHRASIAIEDFSYLLSRYERDPDVFSEQLYWKILYELGVLYKHSGREQEARKTWQKLLSETTDPNYRNLLIQEGLQTG